MSAAIHSPTPWAEPWHAGIDCSCGWTTGPRTLTDGATIRAGSKYGVKLDAAWKMFRAHFANAVGSHTPPRSAESESCEAVRLFDPDAVR